MSNVLDAPENLKPCPHCGSTDLNIVVFLDSIVSVFCNNCFARGPKKFHENTALDVRIARAAEAWNTRVNG